MQKIKKIFLYSLGGFLAFLFGQSGPFAQGETMIAYGVFVDDNYVEPSLWGKILSIVFSPICIALLAVLILVLGFIVFFNQKREIMRLNRIIKKK